MIFSSVFDVCENLFEIDEMNTLITSLKNIESNHGSQRKHPPMYNCNEPQSRKDLQKCAYENSNNKKLKIKQWKYLSVDDDDNDNDEYRIHK